MKLTPAAEVLRREFRYRHRLEVGAMHYVFPTIGGAIFDTMAN